jgi:hypothetical protein
VCTCLAQLCTRFLTTIICAVGKEKELVEAGVVDCLIDAMARYPDSEDVICLCFIIEHNLGAACKQNGADEQ